MPEENNGWKRGPLPPDTYGWGGVVPCDYDGPGFFFADFQGDKVETMQTDGHRILQPNMVLWYNNSLTLPPSRS